MLAVDVKLTTWQRIYLPEDVDAEALIKKINDSDIITYEAVCDAVDSESLELETISERYMSIAENHGDTTVELVDIDSNDKTLWNNKDKTVNFKEE